MKTAVAFCSMTWWASYWLIKIKQAFCSLDVVQAIRCRAAAIQWKGPSRFKQNNSAWWCMNMHDLYWSVLIYIDLWWMMMLDKSWWMMLKTTLHFVATMFLCICSPWKWDWHFVAKGMSLYDTVVENEGAFCNKGKPPPMSRLLKRRGIL